MRDLPVRRLLNRASGVSAALLAVGAMLAFLAAVTPERPVLLMQGGIGAIALGALVLVAVAPIRARLVGRQNDEIARREAILAAAAFAAERFIRPDGLRRGLDEVLEHLGRATAASRVYVYENSKDEWGRLRMSIIHEWVAEGIPPTIDDPENKDYPYTAGFGHWVHKLGDGVPMQVRISDARGTERQDMDSEGVLSLAVVPVLVAGAWWGFLGVDDCLEEREWSSGELEALTVAAATLGAAMSRERWTRDLKEAEERFRVLVEQAPAAVYVDALDENASTLYMSPQIEALTGYRVEDWKSDPGLWPRILHPEDRDRVMEAQAEHNLTGEPFRMEYRLTARDGRTVWIRDEAVMVRDADGSFRHSQGIMQDVTEMKVAADRIEFLAYHDGLTGRPNLTMFRQLTDLAMARANRTDLAVAVLCVDIDSFKIVNDTLGPEGGDELLRQVARRLGITIRDTDTLARRAADEFLILLADLDRGEVGEVQAPLLFAESVAGRIREGFKQPFDVSDEEVFVSASVGISLFPDDAQDAGQLLLHAEHAMRTSKREGPGGFAVYGGGSVDSATTFAFVTRLRKAVERQEWVLHYQPIVRISTGEIHGVEALLRWHTPEGKLIQPNDFIPVAEELGLIESMGDWVVEELVRQERAWRSEGLSFEMGFNLSPRQFWQPDLARRILVRLDAGDVDPRKVLVEITETSAMRDPDRANAILWDLHSRGLRLALDDFGTGYSSLSRLRNLPVDVLKIDRSFVHGIHEDPETARIVSAFIQLAEGLEMTTLAEGIETEAEWRFLAQNGCELGQGFYFSKPLPAAELTGRFRAGELSVRSAV